MNKVKLLTLPATDWSQSNLLLLSPNSHSCGGYIIKNKNNQIEYVYSPIDISVVITNKIITYDESPVKNLYEYFRNNSTVLAEDKLNISMVINGKLYIKTISEWKHVILSGGKKPNNLVQKIKTVLKQNAPFTFTLLKGDFKC